VQFFKQLTAQFNSECMGPIRTLYERLTKYFVQMHVAEFDMDTILQPYETARILLIFNFLVS